jgi:hypothetical protein
MDTAYISAFAALGGSAVGALASFMTTWLTLNSPDRANRSVRAVNRRENLYGEFIEEAAKLYSDALTNAPEDAKKFVHLRPRKQAKAVRFASGARTSRRLNVKNCSNV